MNPFIYKKGHRFVGNVVDVVIDRLAAAQPGRLWLPAYICRIVKTGENDRVGAISVRLGYSEEIVKYGGHIGYGVDIPHRGHHYALEACRLVKEIFVAHGMDVVWITCNPDNWASRRTCERLGCHLVDIVDLPKHIDMYKDGERQKCRYRWIIYPPY